MGGVTGKLFAEAGAHIVAVQDHTGKIYQEAGFNVPALLQHVAEHCGVGGFAKAEVIASDALWDVDCSILITAAALEQQINATNAGRIKVRILVEGANGTISPAADDILQSSNILVLPNVIANAGGMTVSYF